MRVTVTGATGFIGNYVVKELLKRNIGVNVVARDKKKAIAFDWGDYVHIIESDIENFDNAAIKEIAGCDKLIHLAWDGLPNYKNLFHIENNLMPQYFFIKKVIEAGVKDVCITGTCFEYGDKLGCLTEDMPTEPGNPYAIAKDSLRIFLTALVKTLDFQFKWVRLFYIYGHGQSTNSLFSQLERALEKEESVFNMSGGEQVRDFLPVEEVAENIVTIALQNKVTGVINCSSNQPVTVKEFVEKCLAKQKKSIRLNLGYYPYPDYEPMSFWGDNKKLKSIITGL